MKSRLSYLQFLSMKNSMNRFKFYSCHNNSFYNVKLFERSQTKNPFLSSHITCGYSKKDTLGRKRVCLQNFPKHVHLYGSIYTFPLVETYKGLQVSILFNCLMMLRSK